MGATRYLGEDAGLAALIDLSLLSGMYGMFGGAAHSVALAESAGMDPSEFITSLLAPWLVAMTGVLDSITDDSPSDMQIVAVGNIVATSNDQGVDPELLSHLTTPLRQLIGPDAKGLELKEMLNR
ncbi:imine reductase family protein [Kribbella deserti]|uniref:NADPH-dependent reductive aminase-like C-terminal domain-containing protein n=1 Tax=Kribbella deserti TaxID=1926257 RepID=A0ABV6QTG4_9ACTN